MSSPYSFSLQSKWDFDVRQNYLLGKSDATASNWIPAPRLRPGFRSSGIDRQVDFSHRYHQVSLKNEAANKDPSTNRIAPHHQYKWHRHTIACIPLENDEYYKERILDIIQQNQKKSPQITRKEFQPRVKCSRKDDDQVKIAQDRLSCADHPYTNPKPHDFRPDNVILLENKPRMRFLTTPDPGKMVLNKQLSQDRPSSVQTFSKARSNKVGTDIITRVTPQAKFHKDLYFKKGRYSPAFTSHNAYLDRILKNITD